MFAEFSVLLTMTGIVVFIDLYKDETLVSISIIFFLHDLCSKFDVEKVDGD